MAKPKTPFFSLGARGTIADTLTLQKRGRDTIARTKPIPAYRYTLPQAYQRWLYQDYAYLWTQQSEVTKRQYAAAGGRFHLTGFQYWMKYNLANLPDIAGMWHLDKITNSLTPDSSKNANHGTVYGASLVDGVINKALSFDGVDDFVSFPLTLNPLLLSPITIEFFLNPTALHECWVIRSLTTNWTTFWWGFLFEILSTGQFDVYWSDGTYPFVSIHSIGSYVANQPNHLALTIDNATPQLFLNGDLDNEIVETRPLVSDPSTPLRLSLPGDPYFGIIDNFAINNRILAPTVIKRHSERRYPL